MKFIIILKFVLLISFSLIQNSLSFCSDFEHLCYVIPRAQLLCERGMGKLNVVALYKAYWDSDEESPSAPELQGSGLDKIIKNRCSWKDVNAAMDSYMGVSFTLPNLKDIISTNAQIQKENDKYLQGFKLGGLSDTGNVGDVYDWSEKVESSIKSKSKLDINFKEFGITQGSSLIKKIVLLGTQKYLLDKTFQTFLKELTNPKKAKDNFKCRGSSNRSFKDDVGCMKKKLRKPRKQSKKK